jgi:hypothetical protein
MSQFGTDGASLALAAALGGTLYVGLGTGQNVGALTGEASGGGYARAALGTVTFTGHQAQNAATVTFATPTATLGTFTHAAIFDAATGGNCRAVGPLVAAVDWTTGQPVSFPAGAMQFEAVRAP